MNRKDGEYYYAPHGSLWGIWRWRDIPIANAMRTVVVTGGGEGSFVKDCKTKEEARAEVYRLNGWGTPKNKRI